MLTQVYAEAERTEQRLVVQLKQTEAELKSKLTEKNIAVGNLSNELHLSVKENQQLRERLTDQASFAEETSNQRMSALRAVTFKFKNFKCSKIQKYSNI